MSRVVAVVPAKDAAATITATVTALAAIPGVAEVLVVDDGSADDAAAAVASSPAIVIEP